LTHCSLSSSSSQIMASTSSFLGLAMPSRTNAVVNSEASSFPSLPRDAGVRFSAGAWVYGERHAQFTVDPVEGRSEGLLLSRAARLRSGLARGYRQGASRHVTDSAPCSF
jgi:hypothetical protein